MVAYKQPHNRQKCSVLQSFQQNKQKGRKLIGIKPCTTPCIISMEVSLSKETESSKSKKFFVNAGNDCSTKGCIHLTHAPIVVDSMYAKLDNFNKTESKNIHKICIKKEVTGIHDSLPGISH
jgi:hypothetical protein